MYFINDLRLSDAEKFSFDGIPFPRDNLPAKKTIFHKVFGICQLPVIRLTDAPALFKEQICMQTTCQDKGNSEFQELKAIKALWQCFEVHEKTWTWRDRAGLHEEKRLIDGNTKQARILDKGNVRFPGENENSS